MFGWLAGIFGAFSVGVGSFLWFFILSSFFILFTLGSSVNDVIENIEFSAPPHFLYYNLPDIFHILSLQNPQILPLKSNIIYGRPLHMISTSNIWRDLITMSEVLWQGIIIDRNVKMLLLLDDYWGASINCGLDFPNFSPTDFSLVNFMKNKIKLRNFMKNLWKILRK